MIFVRDEAIYSIYIMKRLNSAESILTLKAIVLDQMQHNTT
jgi:hypothetical protein